MKKPFIYLIVIVFMLAMTACGKTEESEPVNNQEESTETVNEADKSDEQLISEITRQLIGSWHCPDLDLEKLVFYDEKTGHYTGIDKEHDFSYTVAVDRLETSNNGRDIEYIMTVTYDTGKIEEIRFITGYEGISGNPEDLKMLFQTVDHGGYSGVMNFFDPWVKDIED